MSVDAVVARVAELQSLMGASVPAPTSAPSAFATQLATASAPAAAPTATTASAGLMSVGASELAADVPFGAEITAAAKKHGIDPALLAGLVKQESGFNPNAGSPAGARGLTQLMPGTAAGLGVTNVLDPAQSARRRREVPAPAARRLRRRRDAGARRLQRRPRRRAALRRRPALRRDPELRPRGAGQRRRSTAPAGPLPRSCDDH